MGCSSSTQVPAKAVPRSPRLAVKSPRSLNCSQRSSKSAIFSQRTSATYVTERSVSSSRKSKTVTLSLDDLSWELSRPLGSHSAEMVFLSEKSDPSDSVSDASQPVYVSYGFGDPDVTEAFATEKTPMSTGTSTPGGYYYRAIKQLVRDAHPTESDAGVDP